jgi:hypothetical protein
VRCGVCCMVYGVGSIFDVRYVLTTQPLHSQIGVLALPYAIQLTGWLGLILLVGVGVVMQYTALLFGRNRRKFMLETFSDNIEVRNRVYALNIPPCELGSLTPFAPSSPSVRRVGW